MFLAGESTRSGKGSTTAISQDQIIDFGELAQPDVQVCEDEQKMVVNLFAPLHHEGDIFYEISDRLLKIKSKILHSPETQNGEDEETKFRMSYILVLLPPLTRIGITHSHHPGVFRLTIPKDHSQNNKH